MRKIKSCLFWLVGGLVSLMLIGKLLPKPPKRPIPGEIAAFAKEHPLYAPTGTVESLEDWSDGKRYRSGSFIYYVKGDEVVSVWRSNPRERVYHDEEKNNRVLPNANFNDRELKIVRALHDAGMLAGYETDEQFGKDDYSSERRSYHDRLRQANRQKVLNRIGLSESEVEDMTERVVTNGGIRGETSRNLTIQEIADRFPEQAAKTIEKPAEPPRKPGEIRRRDTVKLKSTATIVQNANDIGKPKPQGQAHKAEKGAKAKVVSIDKQTKLIRIQLLDGPEKGFVGLAKWDDLELAEAE